MKHSKLDRSFECLLILALLSFNGIIYNI